VSRIGFPRKYRYRATFRNSAEDGILSGSDFHSAEFPIIFPRNSSEWRSLPHKIPSSAEFQKVTSVDTLFRIIPWNFLQFPVAYRIYESNNSIPVRNSVNTEFREHPYQHKYLYKACLLYSTSNDFVQSPEILLINWSRTIVQGRVVDLDPESKALWIRIWIWGQ
jgi:hypothetical protein